jgi:arylsulfatase A-like enzyme
MSDNGYMWGEHGLIAKATAYDQSLRIPMMMRWDGHTAPGTDERLAANIDVAPTVYEATGVTPSYALDGKSLLQQWDRETILAEVYGAISRPELRWAGLIGHDYRYVEYYGGDETVPVFREYYDRVSDPWQLDNLFGDGDPMNDPNVVDLTARLAGYRHCPLVEACP